MPPSQTGLRAQGVPHVPGHLARLWARGRPPFSRPRAVVYLRPGHGAAPAGAARRVSSGTGARPTTLFLGQPAHRAPVAMQHARRQVAPASSRGHGPPRPDPPRRRRPLLRPLLGLLLLLLVAVGHNAGALAVQVGDLVAGPLYLLPTPDVVNCAGVYSRATPREEMQCIHLTKTSWKTHIQMAAPREAGWDPRLGQYFSRSGSKEGSFPPSATEPTGPVHVLSSTRASPLFIWQSTNNLLIASAGMAHAYAPVPGATLDLLAASASTLGDEARALVLVKTTTATVGQVIRWNGTGWLALGGSIPNVRAPGTAGLPGSFFMASTNAGWVWIRPDKSPEAVATSQPVVGMAATRFLSSESHKMDLIVTTTSQLLVYVGLDATAGTWEYLLESPALPQDRQSLRTHLVPRLQDTPRPSGFLYLVHNSHALWRVGYLPPDPNAGPTTGQLVWQPVGRPPGVTFPPGTSHMLSLLPQPDQPAQWVIVHDGHAYMLDREFRCDTDPSIECDPAAGSWRCAPNRLATLHQSLHELCGMCSDGFFPSYITLNRFECRPCQVAGCRTCTDDGFQCAACHAGLLLVCIPTSLARLDIHANGLANGQTASTRVLSTCTSVAYLKNGHLHVSNASVQAPGPTSILAGLEGGTYGMLKLDALSHGSAPGLSVTAVTGLPAVNEINQIAEAGPLMQGKTVYLCLVLELRELETRIVALSCTLPGDRPADECPLQVVGFFNPGWLSKPVRFLKFNPASIGLNVSVFAFQPDNTHLYAILQPFRGAQTVVVATRRNPVTGHTREWLYGERHTPGNPATMPWDVFIQNASIPTRFHPPLGASLQALAPGAPGQVSLAGAPDPDAWRVLSLPRRQDGSRVLQHDILHTGFLQSGSQVHWALVHHSTGRENPDRPWVTLAAEHLLAPVAGVLPSTPLGAWILPLTGHGSYPHALVVATKSLVGVAPFHCPAGGLGSCFFGPAQMSPLPGGMAFSENNILFTALVGEWTLADGRPAAGAFLLSGHLQQKGTFMLVRVAPDGCPEGTFGPECLPCHAECQTCAGPGARDCLVPRCAAFLPTDPGTCLDRCPAGLYPDPTGACACHADCAACHLPAHADRYICTACPPGFGPLDPLQPADHCQPCHSSCAGCRLAASPGHCLSCPGAGLLQPDGTCGLTCPSGTWPDGLTGTCEPCPAKCTECTGPAACTGCRSPALSRPASGWCASCTGGCGQCAGGMDACLECDVGFRWKDGLPPAGDQLTGQCVACPANCLDCQPDGRCTSCRGQLLLSPDAGTCGTDCPADMAVNDTHRACAPCHDTCASCQTPGNAHTCLACPRDRFMHREAAICLDACPEGQYGDVALQGCALCHDACRTCHGPANGHCLACAPGLHLQPDSGACLATCPEGFFPDSGQCQPCDPRCKACTGVSQCQVCHDGHFDPGTGLCAGCHGTCATCSDAVSCLACQPGLVFLSADAGVPSLCGASCPAGQYVGQTRCAACSTACALCHGAADRCQVCAPAHRWQEGPPAGGPEGTAGCVACPAGCASCTADLCLTCLPGRYLTRAGACPEVCPAGTWPDPGTDSCQPCAASCASCTGPADDACTACLPGLEHAPQSPGTPAATGPCRSPCPDGHFRHASSGACVACNPACAACTGPTDTDCWRCEGTFLQDGACVLECATGYLAVEQRCLPCAISCGACSGLRAGDCTDFCRAGLLPLPADVSPMRCVASCSAGFNTSPAGCTACPAGCLSCPDSAAHCTKCARGYFLHGHGCEASCPAGSWADGDRCQPCHDSCAGCQGPGPGHCTACRGPAAPILWAGACHAGCPAGTFLDDDAQGTCLPCHVSCATCSGPGPDQCTACPASRALGLEGLCLDACPPGTFAEATATGGQVCRPCAGPCVLCAGPGESQCTACPEPLLLEAGRCVDSCARGHAACQSRGQCQACPAGCASCDIELDQVSGCAVYCTACRAGHFLSPTTGRCEAHCPAGEFVRSADDPVCHGCDAGCLSCHGQADWCTGCPDGQAAWLSVDTGTCLSACPAEAHAQVPAERLCLACPAGCERCAAPPATPVCHLAADGRLTCAPVATCDRCAAGLLRLLGSTCVEHCPAGFYDDWPASPPACAPCHPKCTGACSGPERSDCEAPARSPAKRRLALGLGISFGLLLLLLLLALALFLLVRLRRASPHPKDLDESAENLTVLNTMLELSLPGAIHVDMAADFAPIDGPLGTGGQASVFAARAVGAGISARLGCPDTVAIKQMKADKMKPLQVTLFQNEIALMLLRDQPHIVRIYGYSEQPPAIIMECFQGDLATLLHSDLALPLHMLLDIAQQWAAGLEAMHAHGVAHCDLKPANVFVSQTASSWRAALGDFGTSRSLAADRASALVTSAPELSALTARYAAPEVISAFNRRRALGTENHLPTDVYSAAIMLWECITRNIPWEGLAFDQVTEGVLAGQRPDVQLAVAPIARASQSLGQNLADLLPLLWAADPQARPPASRLRQSVAMLAVMLPGP
ncbi:TKL protein kinase [Fonticula alba]|uniref:TKL protein kinase n=1 Tax=Fonticula alba TaxID=691883 RepID=A0A058Z252_FONAL|nr:TKL protein kinase [Fonticula alba]KCV67592.1 TKL protein kinase [Fonticula alba]|eukprot:XP_009498033.1 TKL protein kinase [Fonticula alba]